MSQIRPVLPRLLHFEDALHKTGWGLYYRFLVGFTAANLFTNGFVLLSFYFALPLSACDTILSRNDILSVFTCFTSGRGLGGFLCSSISDNTGKKCMISKSLIMIFASCFVCAFSHNIYTLYVAAFFLGSGLQTNTVTMKIYLTEILPAEKRGLYVVLPDLFWTTGYFSTSVFIYYFGKINANNLEHQGMDLRLTPWRIMFAVGGGLCITMGCSSALLEMEPRFLLFKRRIISASLILKQFYAINKSKYSETFDIHSQQLVDLIPDYNINVYPEPVGFTQQLTVIVKVMYKMLKILLKRPFLRTSLLLLFLKLPTLIGLAGSNIFLAQILNNKTETVNGSNLIHLTLNLYNNCTVSFEDEEYRYFLLLSINVLVAQTILLFVIDRFGRKIAIFVGFTLSSLSSVFLAVFDVDHSLTLLAVFSSLFVLGLTLVESSLDVVVIESFPTAVRGTAMGITYFYAHFVSCFLYNFVDMTRLGFLLTLASATLGASILTCFLTDLRGRPMVE